MMISRSHLKNNLSLLTIILCLWFSLTPLLWSCSGSGGSGGDARGTGTAALSIQWHPGRWVQDPSQPVDAIDRIFGGQRSGNASGVSGIHQAITNCAQEGIARITCSVYEEPDNLLLESDSWPCNARSGLIEGIPAGEDRKFVCSGYNDTGGIVHMAQITGVDITPGNTTDAGAMDSRPFVTVPIAPADGADVPLNQFSLSWDSVPNAQRYRVQVAQDAAFQTLLIDDWTTQTTYLPALLPDTDYFWRIGAVDQFGNQGIFSEIRRLTTVGETVCRAPVLAPIGNQEIDEGQSLTLTLAASDEDDGDQLVYSAGPLPTGAGFDEDAGIFTWTPAPGDAGNYPVRFTVCDACPEGPLCASEEIVISVGNVCRPPTLDPIGPRQGFENEFLSFSINATDPDTDEQLTYRAANLPPGALFDAAARTFSWTPGATDAGNYRVRFEVCDDCPEGPLCDGEEVDITIGNVCPPPVLSPIGPRQVAVGQLLELNLAVTNPDPDSRLTYSAGDGFNQFIDAQSGRFRWTPTPEDAGRTYTVEFSVCSDCGENALCDSEAVTITVGDICRQPVLDPIGPRQGAAGDPLEFSANATDPDTASVLTYSAADMSGNPTPIASFFDPRTRTFSWRPEAGDAGVYGLRIQVCDDCPEGPLCDEEVINLTVVPPCLPPEMAPIDSRRIAVGETLALTLSLTSSADVRPVFQADNLPVGADFDAESGIFTWTPTPEDVGSYAVGFAACRACPDGTAQCDGQEAVIEVYEPEPDYFSSDVSGTWYMQATEFNTYEDQCESGPLPIEGMLDFIQAGENLTEISYTGTNWYMSLETCSLTYVENYTNNFDISYLNLTNPVFEYDAPNLCHILFGDKNLPAVSLEQFTDNSIQCRYENTATGYYISLALTRQQPADWGSFNPPAELSDDQSFDIPQGASTWYFSEQGTTEGCVTQPPEGVGNGPYESSFALDVQRDGNVLEGFGYCIDQDHPMNLAGAISGTNVQFRRFGPGCTPGFIVDYSYSGVLRDGRITGTFTGGGDPADLNGEGCLTTGTFTVTF